MIVRVFERDNGDIVVQKRKFGVWVTLYITTDPTSALKYLRALNVEYNEKTGYYE